MISLALTILGCAIIFWIGVRLVEAVADWWLRMKGEDRDR